MALAPLCVPPYPSASPPTPAASHLQARPCQVNSCSPRSKTPQTPALPTAAKATSHPSPTARGPREGKGSLIIRRRLPGNLGDRQRRPELGELPTMPQGRSGLPTLTQCKIHQLVACLLVPRESLGARQPPGLWPGNQERQADASVHWGI